MSIFNLGTWFNKKPFSLRDHTALSTSGDNYTGKPVNDATALGLSAFWACVRLISESIACLPLGLYERDKDGDKIPANKEPLFKILYESPNADMTPIEFWQVVVAYLLIHGNFYGLINYRGTGQSREIVSIYPLYGQFVTVERDENGKLRYTYQYGTDKKEYSEDEIFHVKGMSLGGIVGLSVLSYARNTLGNSMSLEEASGRLMSNGMRPGGALKINQVLKEEQRAQVRKNIADQMGGVARTGGVMVLEAGMEYQSLSINPEDAQMLESRGFGIEEVCRFFGVSPSLVGHTSKTTTWGTGLEQINIGFLTYTLAPWIRRIEQAIKKRLMRPDQKQKLFAEFNIEGFLRADSSGRSNFYASALNNGYMTRAEVRKKENLPYIEGSDKLTVQAALIPLEDLGKNFNNDTTNNEVSE